MANQGWQIEWMSSIIICFYASYDHDYYTVEFNENQDFTNNDEVNVPGHQLKHYEELDYHFICSTKYFSIYHSLQIKNFSIEEDLQKRYFLEVRKKWIVFSIALLLFLSLFLSLVLFQSIKMLFLSSNLFIALFFEYLFYILTIIFFSSHMSTPSHIPILPQNPLSYTYYIDKSVYLHDEIILIIKIFTVMIIVVITLIQKYFS